MEQPLLHVQRRIPHGRGLQAVAQRLVVQVDSRPPPVEARTGAVPVVDQLPLVHEKEFTPSPLIVKRVSVKSLWTSSSEKWWRKISPTSSNLCRSILAQLGCNPEVADLNGSSSEIREAAESIFASTAIDWSGKVVACPSRCNWEANAFPRRSRSTPWWIPSTGGERSASDSIRSGSIRSRWHSHRDNQRPT